MPALKPDVCVSGDRVAVFIGADYKHLTVEQTNALIAKLIEARNKLVDLHPPYWKNHF